MNLVRTRARGPLASGRHYDMRNITYSLNPLLPIFQTHWTEEIKTMQKEEIRVGRVGEWVCLMFIQVIKQKTCPIINKTETKWQSGEKLGVLLVLKI